MNKVYSNFAFFITFYREDLLNFSLKVAKKKKKISIDYNIATHNLFSFALYYIKIYRI